MEAVSAESLEEDLKRLKDAAEKQRIAKERLIQTQQDAIDELSKQRDQLLEEREEIESLLSSHLSLPKEDNFTALQDRITALESALISQDEAIRNFQHQQLGIFTPASTFRPGSTLLDHLAKSRHQATIGTKTGKNGVANDYGSDTLEDNPQFSAIIQKLQAENKHLYTSFEQRYEKLANEMEIIKSFYNNELEREKSSVSKLIEENKEQRALIARLLSELRPETKASLQVLKSAPASPIQSQLEQQNAELTQEVQKLTNKLIHLKSKYTVLKERYRLQTARNSDLNHLLSQISKEEARVDALALQQQQQNGKHPSPQTKPTSTQPTKPANEVKLVPTPPAENEKRSPHNFHQNRVMRPCRVAPTDLEPKKNGVEKKEVSK